MEERPESDDDVGRRPDAAERKPYEPPALEMLGRVEEVTRGSTGDSSDTGNILGSG